MHSRLPTTANRPSAWQWLGRQLTLAAVMLMLAGQIAAAGPSDHGGQEIVRHGQETGAPDNGCGADRPEENLICPTPDDESYPYIERIHSYADSNGIAVLFTDEGMSVANNCAGSARLASMIARLYTRIPAHERAEESIDWAVRQMTGEIRGHAIAYRAAMTDAIRSRANPVNIVFPEYRGEFPGGMAGVTNRAQQLLWATLC